MSSKRYILIFLLLSCSFAFAQIAANLQGEALADDEEDSTFRSRLQLSYPLSEKVLIEIDNDNLWRDHHNFSITQKGYNSLSSRVSASFEDGWYSSSYRHTLYNDSQVYGIYPLWNPLTIHQKKHQHQAWLLFDQDIVKLNVSGSGGYKSLKLTPWELNDIWELEQKQDIQMQDIYGDIAVGYSLSDDLVLSAGTDYAHNENTEIYDHNSAWLNLEYGTRLMGVNLQTNGQVQYRDGDWVDEGNRYQYVMNIRAQQYLPMGLSGYVQYTQRTCSDEEFGKWYLISNYLRTQLKYSFFFDPSSYMIIGGKYAPENEANAFFAETDVSIYKGIYLGLASNMNPDRLTDYSAKLSYHFLKDSQIYVTARNLEYKETNWERQYLGMGFAFYR